MDVWNLLGWEDELILRAVGVLLALLGAVLTSPHGFKRMLFLIKFWLKSRLTVAQMWLSKHFKFIHRPSITAYADSIFGGNGTLTGRGFAGITIPVDATTEEKVVLLEAALRNVQNLVNSDYENLDKKVTEVKNLVSEVSEKTAELHAKMVKGQEEAASLDAAGIPVIASGIFLSGIPRELALYPIAGWVFVALSVILAFAMTRKTINDGSWGKKGSEA